MMNTTVTRGEAEGIVIATGEKTEVGMMNKLIAEVDEPSHFETVLNQMLVVLILTGVLANCIIISYMVSQELPVLSIMSFNVVLLIASIPIALRVVCVSVLAVGCRELAQEGAIVSRLSAIEELAGMTVLCSDKTGTLTLNKMQLEPNLHLFNNHKLSKATLQSLQGQDCLFLALLATKWWEPPRDAIDTLVHANVKKAGLDQYEHVDFLPFDPSIKRTAASIKDNATGQVVHVCKGAPNILLEMCDEKEAIREEFEAIVEDLASRGIRSLAVMKSSKQQGINLDEPNPATDAWEMVGIITFLDPPRPDTKRTIEAVAHLGSTTKMITGDHQLIAKETARVLGMVSGEDKENPVILTIKDLPDLDISEMSTSKELGDKYGDLCANADGFAGVFPQHKFLIVQSLRQQDKIVGMTGDGVNDAPALKRADVGIAVMGATDAARASSDIVLTREGLSTIALAILVSRKIFARMQNFVIYRVACTWQLLFFFLIGCLTVRPVDFNANWPAFFSIPVIALVTITILNDGTIISVAFDNVKSSVEPEKWDLPCLFVISSSIGGTALISSLILLQWGLDSADEKGYFGRLGLSPLEYGQLMTMMYLKVSLSDYLSLFNARTRSWMWTRVPSTTVVAAGALATAAATLLAVAWPFGCGMDSIELDLVAFVWAYTLLASLVQDAAKMVTYATLQSFGLVPDTPNAKSEDLMSYLENAKAGSLEEPEFVVPVNPAMKDASDDTEKTPLLSSP